MDKRKERWIDAMWSTIKREFFFFMKEHTWSMWRLSKEARYLNEYHYWANRFFHEGG